MTHSQILGTGAYAPSRILTNHDLEEIINTSDAWITERTGIKERHIAADGEVTSDMAAAAARRALEMAETAPIDLDMIIVGTISPDMPMRPARSSCKPSLALRGPLPSIFRPPAPARLWHCHRRPIDPQRPRQTRSLIGAESLSRLVDWEDRGSCVLLGDAAGAVVLGPTSIPAGLISTHLHSDGAAAGILMIPGGGSKHPQSDGVSAKRMNKIAMNGREVYKYATRVLPKRSLRRLPPTVSRPAPSTM